jgi:hypothetical protein
MIRFIRWLLRGLRFRKSITFLFWTWHFTQNGYSSRSFKLGPWSRNTRSKRTRMDLPGPFSWEGRRR